MVEGEKPIRDVIKLDKLQIVPYDPKRMFLKDWVWMIKMRLSSCGVPNSAFVHVPGITRVMREKVRLIDY